MRLTVPVVRTIQRIMRTCQHKTESYNLDSSSSQKDSEEKYKVTFHPSLPEIVESMSPPKDMEAAWEELSENPDSTIEASHNPPTSEEIISTKKELYSAIGSRRRNMKLYKNEA